MSGGLELVIFFSKYSNLKKIFFCFLGVGEARVSKLLTKYPHLKYFFL